MLMKLTPVVNFPNILEEAFAQIFFQQKLQSTTLALLENSAGKMLMKLTPGRRRT